MTQVSTSLITADSVSRSYGKVKALDDVNLNINSGEIVGLLGPNGAGKTTLIQILLGALQPDSGSVSVANNPAGSLVAKRNVGAVLQSTELPEQLTINELITLQSSYYPNPRPLAEIIEMAMLGGLEKRRFKQLSGGQQQRLFFALAICGQPKVVFLDEPTVGLDARSRLEFWDCLKTLASSGTSILLTTHYLEEADSLADRLYLLDQGKIVADGTPEAMKSTIGGTWIRFKSTLNANQFKRLKSVQTMTTEQDYICLRSDQPEQTLRDLLAMDQSVSSISVTQSSLEQAFLKITDNDELTRTLKTKELAA